MTYYEIYETYKALHEKTGLYNHVLACLAHPNKWWQKWAAEKVDRCNFKTKGDVMLYVAMNI
jgi:hypothetical protein